MDIKYIFIVFSLLIVASAIYVLMSKSVVHAAFMLLFTFLGVAGIFVMAGADFLAIAQIMIYIGGILVLLVFGVLLTNKNNNKGTDEPNRIIAINYNRILGGFTALSIFGCLFYIFTKISFTRLEGNHYAFFEQPKTIVQTIGMQLIVNNSVALEAIGVLLIGALIGAGFIAKQSIPNK
jgi:NADH:ubiquinone oxidoreductase subunit 6 (subunit J)